MLTTFSDTLANALRTKLKRLITHEPRLAERLEVHSMNAVGLRLYELNIGSIHLVSREALRERIEQASETVENPKFSRQFLLTEWEQVVDAWQLESWEAYRDVKRLGRKTHLPEVQSRMLTCSAIWQPISCPTSIHPLNSLWSMRHKTLMSLSCAFLQSTQRTRRDRQRVCIR